MVQVVSQDGAGGGTQSAGQLTGIVQDAGAVADAQQTDVGALAWSADDLDQSNVVTSDAAVALSGTIAQGTEQVVDAADRAAADQWGGQEVDLAQAGRADATSSQHDAVLTRPGAHSASSVATAAGTAAVDQQLFQDGVAGGGSLSQWSGQLALVEQALDADATVVQTGTRRSRVVGGTAGAFATATDLVLIEQLAGQSAARLTGTGSQAILQAAYAAQDASAHAATTQQAGAAKLSAALSDADALNRAAIVQEAAQSSSGALDVQDISQTSIVVQRAVASSVSFGGIAGSAAVVNCGVTQQAAAQSTGSGATLPDADLSAFCAPAASPQGPSPVASAPSLATGDEALAASGLPSATAAAAGDEEEATVFRGSRDAAAAGTQSRRAAPAAGAPSARSPGAPRAGAVGQPPVFRPALLASALRLAPGERCGGRRRRSGSRCFRRWEEAHRRGSLRSQPRCRVRGRRGSQRSSWPLCSCHHSCCGRERRRSSGGRRMCWHRSTCRSDLFVTPHLTRWARARWATCDSAVTKGCEIRVTQTARTRSARGWARASGERAGGHRVQQGRSEGERAGVDPERDGRPDRRCDVGACDRQRRCRHGRCRFGRFRWVRQHR